MRVTLAKEPEDVSVSEKAVSPVAATAPVAAQFTVPLVPIWAVPSAL